jgi:RHS repeat-associated protein
MKQKFLLSIILLVFVGHVLHAAAPAISSFSPSSGPVGTLVTINGTNLGSPTAFSIGGTAAIVVLNTGTQLIGMVMPGSVTGVISLTTSGGTVTSGNIFTLTATSYPSLQQGGELVGTGNVGGAGQGSSVAISADGNTALIGGAFDNNNQGAAWVYTRNGSTWTQQGAKLVGTGNVGAAYQGFSVAISADGNTVMEAGYGDNNNQGAVWVFTRSNGTWTQQGNKLVVTGNIGAAGQGGLRVALSADGNTAILGGLADNVDQGAAWIFTRSGIAWTQQGVKLVGTGNIGQAEQGCSVAISADGNTAIVGGLGDNASVGASWVFTRSGGIWIQQGNKIVGTGNIGQSGQGIAVALSADGNTAIIGGYGDNNQQGGAWIFIRSGSTWTQQGSKIAGTANTGITYQGQSIAISANGNTAVIGGRDGNVGQGAAWTFTRVGSTWAQKGTKLVGTGYTGQDSRSYSVAISADASTAIAGWLSDNNGQGAAWVFTSAPPATPTITSFSPSSGPVGTLVTLNGTNLNSPISFNIGGKAAIVISNSGTQLVGMVMPGAVTGSISLSTPGGSANVGNFIVTATSYPSAQQSGKIVGTGNIGAANQGASVAISSDGNTAAVGGVGDNGTSGFGIGAIWIYTRSGNSWQQQGTKLIGSGSIGQAQQGCSIAISADGNTVIEGARSDNNSQGAVWIFSRNNGIWTQQGPKLTANDNIGAAGLGSTVSVSADGNTAIVGGKTDNNFMGAVWVFARTGNIWAQQGAKLVDTSQTIMNNQGYSVAISADGKTAVTGELGNVHTGGAICIYNRIGNSWTQQGPKLLGSGSIAVGSNTAQQGWSVAISADGNTVIEGGNNDNTGIGAAWIFIRNGNTWTQQGNKLVGMGNVGRSFQGASVAINADGNTAIIGGTSDNSSQGAMWIFSRTANTWTQQGTKLSGSNNIGAASQGTVAISADGNTAIIGGSQDNGSQGAMWVFSSLSLMVANTQILPTKQNAIKNESHQLTAAEPIQLGTGSYEYSHTDFREHTVNDSLNFTRFYNSLNNSVNSPIGYGWSHSYNFHLNIQRNSSTQQDTLWSVQYPDGHQSGFIPYGTSGQSIPLYIGTQDSLIKNTGGDLTLFTKDNHRYHFTSAGVFDQMSDLNGNNTTLTYTGNNLTGIAGPGGRTLKLTYNGSNIASVTDPLNRSCSYTYDANGNLISAKDANGNATTFTYDANHSMLSATNPLGNIIVNNTYDGKGRVANQLDAYSQSTTIAYDLPLVGDATVTNPDNSQLIAHHDSSYRKTSVKDELGFTKTYTYDANSNENSFTDENGQVETRQFDKLGNLLVRNRPGSVATQVTYNALNSPLKLTDPNGNVTTFTYDANDNLISMQLPDKTVQNYTVYSSGLRNTFKDARGNTTTYTYSSNGDLLSVAAPTGTKTYTYDAAGRRTSTNDENGNTTILTYDNNDNIISIKDALNHTTSFAFDANNQIISVTDKNGYITSFTYDKKGRMLTKINANGGITKNTYDVRDNLISVTDPNNNTVTYTYDKKGKKTAVTTALGTTQTQFDGVGNLTKLIDGTSKTTTYTYTPTYKMKTVSDGLSNTTSYAYDKNNNLLSVTDPLNKTTAYSYDAMSRLISIVDALNNTTNITYDENGNKKTVADPNGHTQTYTYDAANRLIAYLDAAGNTTSYTYDAAGNMTGITKPTGTIIKTYDAINRLGSVINSTGDSYNYTYDYNDNVLTAISVAGTSYFVYDKLNELTQYTDPFNKKILYSYDAAGNKQVITYPGNKTVSYTYDKANNLKQIADWLSHTFTYTYDAAGRTTQLLYPNGIHCDYTFDGAGRLTGKNNGASGNTIVAGSTFTLDAVGNRIAEQKQGAIPSNLLPASKAYTYGNDDRMLKDSIWTYVNDNAGNRISETKGSIKATYTFSVDDRLSKMVDTTGNTLNFTYDALGHRLSKTSVSDNKRYVVDASSGLSQVLQVTDASGAIRSQYVYGQGLLERVDSTNNVLYYQYDGQHNTVALTDATGAVTDTYTYDPFGTMLSHKGNTNQPFTFLGEFGVEQESSSLYYARARYYDAVNGRFLSKDSYPYSLTSPQTIDRYAYSSNNPLTGYDYTGLYKSQDNSNQTNNQQSFLQYLGSNTDPSEIGSFASDIAGSLLEYAPAGTITTALGEINNVSGSIYLLKDAYDVSKSSVQFAYDAYNNKATGSEWAHTLKTIAVTGGAIAAGTLLTAASAPLVTVAAVGIGFYALDKGVDYLWERNHWDNALNKLW